MLDAPPTCRPNVPRRQVVRAGDLDDASIARGRHFIWQAYLKGDGTGGGGCS